MNVQAKVANVAPDRAAGERIAAERPAREPPVLAEIAGLLRGFREGDAALARRRDLRELHDRLLRQIAARPEPAAPGEAPDLGPRLAALEAAMLRIEGAVHVELGRLVTGAVVAALDRMEAERRARARRGAFLRAGLLVLAVIVAVAVAHIAPV